MNNGQVVQRFWDNSTRYAQSRSLFYNPTSGLFSYNTIILQRLGKHILGNGTKYSQTTSCHQSIASMYNADVVLYNVPRGCQDLLPEANKLYYILDYILNS